ncbi:MAG: pyridoxal 5'-phosphate synthase glutaminase subunit PdxT [Lachnospiraceae bacterium]|nr:pyridoxal 5'-phosphate synthase glutaminase subunit PdxT [Lachnospiraceae bacterium]MDE7334265.1 pyridoxal 5'-phosphate synthase glutaminase subunit PdxT [Lachnospiraceae bacterium]
MCKHNLTIAILALQGAFREHQQALEKLNVSCFEIRQSSDLTRPFDGLILPGGESTVMGKLLWELNLFNSLKAKIEEGLPVFGTCAGLILLAGKIESAVPHLGTMEITARRNAYGRQLGSFQTHADFGGNGIIPMIFIRAPYITAVSENAEILARVDGNIVAARQKNQLATAFHPELSEDLSVHQYFLNMIQERESA